MILFACDSSGRAASAALTQDGEVVAEGFLDAGRTHSETLMPLCDQVFHEAGLTPHDVDVFAVTVGPGSFTGLRIGVGAVKGMAFAAEKPCVGVSTLEAYAWGFPSLDGTVVPVSDARRGRVYTAAFSCGTPPCRLAEDGILPAGELEAILPGEKPLLFVGDAAEMCYTIYRNRVPAVHWQPELLRAPWVAAAARFRVSAGQTVSADALRPCYLQLSQAERERQKKQTLQNGEQGL